ELWYDDRDIPFLRSDLIDIADVQTKQAIAIKTLVDAGFVPESAVDAVTANELTRLDHSQLVSVNLQPAGWAQRRELPGLQAELAGMPAPTPTPPNGKGP